VELTQRYMQVDAVFVLEQTPDGHVYRAVAGDGPSFNISLGLSWNGPCRYVERLEAGEIPSVICDVPSDSRASDLPVIGALVGSVVGVPLRLSDGSLYGALCSLSHQPNPALGEPEVRFMSMLGELVVHDLDERSTQQKLSANIIGLIEAETVDVAYQPIFDVRSNRCLGIEALARFPEPFTRPDHTFALAERLGLGLQLEELVIRRAWEALGLLGEGQFLALNLTPASLLALARRANQRPEVALSALVVEVTEHTAIDAYGDLRRELEQLCQRGLRIAVDDAGAGYASLRHVLELGPDIVKIDRSLIHGLADDRARRIAVSAFVALAHDLGSNVVAEGVELPADYDAICELGVDAAQGYLLGRPSTDPNVYRRWVSGRLWSAKPTRAPEHRSRKGACAKTPYRETVSSSSV